MKRTPFRVAAATALASGLSVLGVFSVLPPVAHATSTYPVTYSPDFLDEISPSAAVTPPAGANIPCTPTAAHPYPVVLVHGTFENEDFNWTALSPLLADNGYCVYTFNYGEVSTNNTLFGQASIPLSAAQLATEVDTVLSETGASKVDIVGHSQGGMMPRYYINDLGGAAKVNMLVGLAPSNNGTTVDGLGGLAFLLDLGGSSTCTSCVQQIQGSSFLQSLNAVNDGVNLFVKYVVIETDKDEIVTPYTSAFLTGIGQVQNVTLQNQCPGDSVGHIGMAFDGPAFQDVLQALAGNPDVAAFQPTCTNFGLPL